jgi:hypothetical protein
MYALGRFRSLSGAWQWRAVITSANAQPTLAFYAWSGAAGAYLPFALNVLTLRDDALVTDVTAFIVRAQGAPDLADYRNYPEQPIDERQLAGTFGRFGVPDRLN